MALRGRTCTFQASVTNAISRWLQVAFEENRVHHRCKLSRLGDNPGLCPKRSPASGLSVPDLVGQDLPYPLLPTSVLA